MDAAELLETITRLIDQAERGDIDPWDVQVIEVIDRYLELMEPKANPKGYENDLSRSGQAFLSASMLVLFKANTLMQLSAAEVIEGDELDEPLLDGEGGLFYPVQRLQLEKHLRRRLAAMPPPKRRVTLPELIEQLQIMAKQLKLVEKANKPKRIKRQPSLQTMREALELAHQENLTEVALELEQVLLLSAQNLHGEENYWSLEELVQMWTNSKPPALNDSHSHSEHSDKVGVFWALLLLSAQSKVELFQEEFYQEIKIRLLQPNTAISSSGRN
ncbi:chromosome segregation and condensation protein ScpA [Richelia sinica FACHB-800]|uniref:Segregation and condensation protein A n=1 Tax=Richelia sinica FACHB-800 TaxID=1357546 RepID=A0A975T868_9NOST|nr:ScpA family protein [Richelia sinica]MBD2666285.1 segregation/condensation protein A [Richelia sinica FACHB-800]QXE23899.1 chromosome segregation and condensation protein ScpA [Richelia sinica FACHB-800]